MTNPTAEITTAQAARTAVNPPSMPWTRAGLAMYGYQKLSFANHASDSFMGRITASTNDSPAIAPLIVMVRRRPAPDHDDQRSDSGTIVRAGRDPAHERVAGMVGEAQLLVPVHRQPSPGPRHRRGVYGRPGRLRGRNLRGRIRHLPPPRPARLTAQHQSMPAPSVTD